MVFDLLKVVVVFYIRQCRGLQSSDSNSTTSRSEFPEVSEISSETKNEEGRRP